MSLEKRLAALESAQRSDGVRLIVVKGGIPDSGPLTVRVGNQHLTQGKEEADENFFERIKGVAFAEGVDQVIVGGLPDHFTD